MVIFRSGTGYDWFQETRWFRGSIRMSVMWGSITKY